MRILDFQFKIYTKTIQKIQGLSSELKHRYRTVWEISQKDIIDMAVERSPYVDQSQSMNLFLAEPNFEKLCSMHFYAWKKVRFNIIRKNYSENTYQKNCDLKLNIK